MIALFATDQVLSGVHIDDIVAGFFAALFFGVINAIIKPIFTILTIPITILTFGLFLLVINGLMLLLTSALVPGFWLAGLWEAIIASIILSILNWMLTKVFYQS